MRTVGRGKPGEGGPYPSGHPVPGHRYLVLWSFLLTHHLLSPRWHGWGGECLFPGDHCLEGVPKEAVLGGTGWDASSGHRTGLPHPTLPSSPASLSAAPLLITELPIATSPNLESSLAPLPLGPHIPSVTKSCGPCYRQGPRICFLYPSLFLLMYPQASPLPLARDL